MPSFPSQSPHLHPSLNGSFIPPGCDAGQEDDDEARHYEDSLVKGFWCPSRLRGRNESLIEAVNDWHFAMLNDSHRNKFYWNAMEGVVQDKRVIDIGAGSCLLSLMAGKLKASKVIAIEASNDMVELAKLNIQRNGQNDTIRVVHNLSSKLVLREEEKADVIVSETLGALMLGEGMLDYLVDARRRLATPDAVVIPALGNQYAVLISSPTLAMISSVQSECNQGFDLSAIGSLQDTGNLFFTKQWGFRLNSLPDIQMMSERFNILSVEFGTTQRKDIPLVKTFRLEALQDGIVHAVVASWEVFGDKEKTHRMTTHPEETKDQPWGFARDMQWGQGLQLVEDFGAAQKSTRNSPPAPFEVKKGEPLLLTVRFSNPCRQTFQFTLQREIPK
jgi:protein arginine N-methyltransferase 7